jgi:hypothetical protein
METSWRLGLGTSCSQSFLSSPSLMSTQGKSLWASLRKKPWHLAWHCPVRRNGTGALSCPASCRGVVDEYGRCCLWVVVLSKLATSTPEVVLWLPAQLPVLQPTFPHISEGNKGS